MEPVKLTFADRLDDLIKTKGVTLYDIAEKTGISTASISKYVNDKSDASSTNVCKLADYFNVTIDYLLGRSEYKSIPNAAVGKATGFSDYAINVLKNRIQQGDEKFLITLSEIIEDEGIIEIISRYFFSEALDKIVAIMKNGDIHLYDSYTFKQMKANKLFYVDGDKSLPLPDLSEEGIELNRVILLNIMGELEERLVAHKKHIDKYN